jgi:type IV secretory pathway TraG/TraD family ATPase VirD4
MSTLVHDLTHGLSGICSIFVVTLAPVLVGLAHSQASWRRFVLSPLFSIAVVICVGIVASILSPLFLLVGLGRESILEFLFDLGLTIGIGYAAGRLLATPRGAARPEHRRGAMVTAMRPAPTQPDKPASLWRSRKRPVPGAGVMLAGVSLALEDETKHFKIVGTTGTGKSTAIREILTGALARGDRVVIADPDGGYAARFYDPARGDVILSPFQREGRKWDLFGEVVNAYDVDQLARSLIPDSGDPDRVWGEYARTFLSTVMRQLIRTGNRDDRELFRLLTAAPDDELRTLLTGTAATPFLKVGNEKMFGCIRSVAGSAVKVLEYIVEQQATPFSVRQWVRDGRAKHAGGPGGVLFIPYTAGEIAALRSVISSWMRLAIFQAMDREEGDQRLWFVVDELDALGEIDGLKDALARLRKFGGRCILGFQSISQVSGTYGKGIAETIVENCGNTYILRCSASEHGGTSEFASKLIGQREVLHTTHSTTRQSQWSWKSSITSSQQIKIEPAVMASEIERLPDLTGFLKLASIPDWQTATLTRQIESTAPAAWRPSSTMTPLAPTTPPAATVTPAAASPASATASLSLPATPPSKPRRKKSRSTTTARTRQPNAAPQAAPVQNLTGGAQSPPPSP